MTQRTQQIESARAPIRFAAPNQFARAKNAAQGRTSYWLLSLALVFLFITLQESAQAGDDSPSESVEYVDSELYYNKAPKTASFSSVLPLSEGVYVGEEFGPPPTNGFVTTDSFPSEYPGAPIPFEPWEWHVLPEGVIYRPYMAGVHESRISGVFYQDQNHTRLLDVALGGQVPILRFGSFDPVRPQGWQLDLEGAAFPRLNLDQNWDVEATDFRFGVPLTVGMGNWQGKLAYYHLSSHLGDEFAIRNPGSLMSRINFSRDVLVVGVSHNPIPGVRLYGEAGWAFHHDGGSEPWEFQLGAEYSPPGPTGICGAPFVAVNAHLRQEHDFGGNFVAQAGWLWRGETDRAFRAGVQYYNGKSNQFQFYDQFEEQIGAGLWYDY